MKLLIRIIERRLDKMGESICRSGQRSIKFFKKDYPNGVTLTRDEFEKFIRKHRLNKFDVGVICHSLFQIYNCPSKATIIDLDYYWDNTKKKVLLDRFFELAKNTKLLK